MKGWGVVTLLYYEAFLATSQLGTLDGSPPLAMYSSSPHEVISLNVSLNLSARIPDDDFRKALEPVTMGDKDLEARLMAAINGGFEDYCAHPPAFQQRSMSGPLPENFLNASNLELVGVQLVFRHGARDLASNQQCFLPMKESFRHCHVGQMVIFEKLGGRQTPLPMVKVVMNAYPKASKHVWTHATGCGIGQLVDEAIPMTFAFADALQDKYFKRFPKVPEASDMRFYASDEQRTLGTLYYILHQLLPTGMTKGGDLYPLYTRPRDTDPWERKVPCPLANSLAETVEAEKGSTDDIHKLFPDFAQRWRAVAGTDFQASFKDCLTVAMCLRQDGLQLPVGLQPSSALFQDALRVSLAMFHISYLQNMKAQQLLMAPALIELETYIGQQVSDEGPLVSFWSTHDNTMIAMLVALGIWDGVWPPYTDSLVLEVYRSKDAKKQAYFRWLRSGKQMVLPWCHGIKAGPAGLCKVEHFLPEEIAALRPDDSYKHACKLPISWDAPLKSMSLSVCLLVFFAVCLTSCVAGYYLHAALRSWRKRVPSETNFAQPLLRVV
jgi:hypothetical protein